MFRLSTIALLLSCTAAAADTLAPVLVEAEVETESTEPQVGDVVLEEYTGSHRRINSERLQQAGASIGEVLSFEAGVQHRQTGAEGSFSSVSIRGSTGAQTPIYWDGMLLNGAANPSVDLSDLEMLNLGAIDVYRGVAPAQLGTGGMAGALNLRSPQAQAQSTKIRLETGSLGRQVLQLGSATEGNRWKLSGTLSSRKADNNFDLLNNNGTPLNTNDDSNERRHNAQFERHALLSKFSFTESDSVQWDASLQHNQREQGVPEWRNNPDNQASYATDTTYLQINRRSQNTNDSNWSTRVGLYQQWRRQQYDDRLSQVGLGAQLDKSSTDMIGLTGYAEYIGERGTLAFHADSRHESFESLNQLNSEQSEARRNSLELTAQYSRFSADERWLFNSSIRSKSNRDKFKGNSQESRASEDNSNAALQLGLRHQLSGNTIIRANLGQHHREPSFYELFGNEGLFVGNDELTAEKGVNLDVAIERHFSKGSLEFGLYNNERDDLITTAFNAQGIGRSINVGQSRLQGVEFSIAHQTTKNIELQLSASLINSENLSNLTALRGKQLPGLASRDLTLRASKRSTHSAVWIETKALSGRFFDSVNLLPAEDTIVHNIGASWQLGQWLGQAAIHNLTDERVQDYNGFDKPGRTAQLSVQYRF